MKKEKARLSDQCILPLMCASISCLCSSLVWKLSVYLYHPFRTKKYATAVPMDATTSEITNPCTVRSNKNQSATEIKASVHDTCKLLVHGSLDAA